MTNADASTGTPAASVRRHDIDWVRTGALGLLIVYHIVVSFQPFAPLIAFIQNEKTLDWLWIPMMAINVWRIPVLFLISGMGVRFAMRRRDWRALLNDRSKRILLPLVFGSLFVAPWTVWFASLWYRWAETGIYFPTQGHLWFLGNIYAYVLVLLPVLYWMVRHPGNVVLRATRWIVRRPLGIFVFAVPIIAEVLVVQPDHYPSYAGNLHGFVLGFALFALGAVFVEIETDFSPAVRRHRWIALAVGFGLYLSRVLDLGLPPWVVGFESMTWMLAVLGFAARHLDRPSKGLSYLSAAVYPVYIVHLPVQLALAFWLFRTEIPAVAKLVLMIVGTFGVSLGLYEALKRVRWLRPVFGMKALPRAAPAGGS